MSTSPLGGRTLYNDGITLGAAQLPIDTVAVRDVLLNNLCHYADTFGQTRVAWCSPISTYASKQFLRPRTSPAPVVDEFYEIGSFGPFPIQLRADGSPYKLAIWATGFSSAGDTVTFRIAVCPVPRVREVIREAQDWVWQATTTSTTSADLSGTSRGSAASATLLTLSAARASGWASAEGTLVDLAGAPAGVEQTLVSVCVWAASTDAASYPALSGLYAREWIGV